MLFPIIPLSFKLVSIWISQFPDSIWFVIFCFTFVFWMNIIYSYSYPFHTRRCFPIIKGVANFFVLGFPLYVTSTLWFIDHYSIDPLCGYFTRFIVSCDVPGFTFFPLTNQLYFSITGFKSIWISGSSFSMWFQAYNLSKIFSFELVSITIHKPSPLVVQIMKK